MISRPLVGPVEAVTMHSLSVHCAVLSFATMGMPRLGTALTVLQEAKGQFDWKALS